MASPFDWRKEDLAWNCETSGLLLSSVSTLQTNEYSLISFLFYTFRVY
jgi:hypothetical protein